MELIADILMVAGALAAAFYCLILGRRLKKFNSLEKGVGGAVAVLSSQVEDLKNTLETAQKTAAASAETLTDLSVRGEDLSKRLEIQMAALHDLPPQEAAQPDNLGDRVQSAPPRVTPEPANTQPTPGEPMFIRHAAGDVG